jgi:hypothetical protein
VTVTERAPVVAALETVAVALIVVAFVTDTDVNDTPVPDAETVSDDRKFVPRIVTDTAELTESVG